ncbi:hypothetical protein D5086_014082 [Populus alba]|uniref:Uncharacterized protein n=1 Tax=Populus alba TaxID=43335 RepID=A0ACC4C6S6_POPAL
MPSGSEYDQEISMRFTQEGMEGGEAKRIKLQEQQETTAFQSDTRFGVDFLLSIFTHPVQKEKCSRRLAASL